MNQLYEYSDILNSPIEAFYCESPDFHLPVESHWHYFVELIYVFRGSITATCNEHTYALTAGSMLLLPPQAIHAIYTADAEEDFHYACVKFNINHIQLVGNYLPNLNLELRKMAQKENPPLLFDRNDFYNFELDSFFHELVAESTNRYYGYNSYIYTKLSALMLKVMRVWYYRNYMVQAEETTEQGDYTIQDVLIYIDEHSHENINIEELAHMCNMSYSYFAKFFHKQYGQSCKQYIEFIRLSKVENLLLFTEMDLSSIAAETGFSDCSHLIRCFKRRYLITPKQFRLKHRSEPIIHSETLK